MFFTPAKGLAKIISRKALLLSEWPSLGAMQHVSKICKFSFDVSAISPAMHKCHQILVIHPLITDDGS
ncbi:hypothetical protein [Mycobacterium montefiorense]|uniref:hypothetical protein n=1 Tax=Mycobacterium montefiorense TaxID=154654 RepID=UPI000D594751|nr:hypothetical protein [Mycobacterium montefiorense]